MRPTRKFADVPAGSRFYYKQPDGAWVVARKVGLISAQDETRFLEVAIGEPWVADYDLPVKFFTK